MTNSKYLISLRSVQEYIIRVYGETGKAPGFRQAINELLTSQSIMVSGKHPQTFDPDMSIDEFEEYMLNREYDITGLIETPVGFTESIEEPSIIPKDKDIYCYTHLPFRSDFHAHKYIEINYVLKGSCKLVFTDSTVTLGTGDLYIVAPSLSHYDEQTSSSFVLGIAIRASTFDRVFGGLLSEDNIITAFFQNSLYSTSKSNYLILKTDLTDSFRHILQELAYETACNEPYSQVCSICLFELLMAKVFRKYEDSAVLYRPELSNEYSRDFLLILQFIKQNYTTITLSELASVFHFSESYLSKLIKKIMNQSFTSIVTQLRMKKAINLLSNSNVKVADISEMLGYDSPDHFCRVFKKNYSISPSRYRKELSVNNYNNDSHGLS